MKNTLIILFFSLFIFLPSVVQAEDYHKKGYHNDLYNVTNNITQEQHLKHFMIELLNKDIIQATRNYYEDKEISGMSFNWEDNHNVVEITEPHISGDKSGYPFIVKITITPGNEKPLGTDTLTFGIFINSHPDSPDKTTITSKLLKYVHNDLPKE